MYIFLLNSHYFNFGLFIYNLFIFLVSTQMPFLILCRGLPGQ